MGDDAKKGPRYVSVVAGYKTKPDGSIEFMEDGGPIPDDVKQMIHAERERQMDYEGRRRALWGDYGEKSMTRLARMFPSLREVPGVDPWEPLQLLKWMTGGGPTSGSFAAALFVLGVWNPSTDWAEEARSFPPRPCSCCNQLGVVDREDGDQVQRAPGGGFVRPKYDEDGERVGTRPVETKQCDNCDGKGEYVPSIGKKGRFDLFSAMGSWDSEHKRAFQTWVEYPFWP